MVAGFDRDRLPGERLPWVAADQCRAETLIPDWMNSFVSLSIVARRLKPTQEWDYHISPRCRMESRAMAKKMTRPLAMV